MNPAVEHLVPCYFDYKPNLVSLLGGRLMYSRSSIDSFFLEYDQYINRGYTASLAEIPQEKGYSMLVFDFDISKPVLTTGESKDIHLYTEKQVNDLVVQINSCIQSISHKTLDKNLFTCVLLEKPARLENGKIKNGFHLQYLNLFLTLEDKSYLFDLIQPLSKLPLDRIEKSPWLLLGSAKNATSGTYKPTTVYTGKNPAKSSWENFDLSSYKWGERFFKVKNLPRLFSIYHFGREVTDLDKRLKNLENPKKVPVQPKPQTLEPKNELEIEKNLKEARKYLQLLKDERSENYQDWIRVGWLLFNISDGTDDGFELWDDFSSRCPEKHDSVNAKSLWDRFEQRDLGLGSLKMMAKEDNPKEYAILNGSRSLAILRAPRRR